MAAPGGPLVLHEMGGEPGAPVVLVCHATGFCARAYDRLAAELARRHRVLGPDFRGHGESAAGPGAGFAWSELAADLTAVCDFVTGELGADGPVAAFGHSMGGAIVLLAQLARPGLFAAGYLYEPVVLPTAVGKHSNRLAAAARRRRPSFSSRAEALARYASRPPLDRLEAGVLADYVAHGFKEAAGGGVELRCTPAVEAATAEGAGEITVSDLAKVELRAEVACGGETGGAAVPSLWAPAIASALRASYRGHATLGHFGPLEDPRRIGAEALSFLAG